MLPSRVPVLRQSPQDALSALRLRLRLLLLLERETMCESTINVFLVMRVDPGKRLVHNDITLDTKG